MIYNYVGILYLQVLHACYGMLVLNAVYYDKDFLSWELPTGKYVAKFVSMVCVCVNSCIVMALATRKGKSIFNLKAYLLTIYVCITSVICST